MTYQPPQFDQNEVRQAFIYCKQHKLLKDPVGRSFKRAFSLGSLDEEMVKEFISRMRKHQWMVEIGAVPPFGHPEITRGALVLGHAWNRPDIIYRIPVSYLAGNTLITGSSGSGKTLRAYFMAIAVAMLLHAVWLVDLRKKEFRRLRAAFQRMGKQLICLDARRMKLNPLQPPAGVDPRNWATQVADLLIQVLRLPPRSSKLAATLIHHLYKNAGVYKGGTEYPTLFCLLEATRNAKDANPQSRLALIDNLEPLLLATSSVFGYHVGWTTHDLRKQSIVFELDSVGEIAKDLILNTIILGEFTSRIAQGISNPAQPDLWVCCDEANRLASGSAGGQFGLSNLICVVRGTGIALDLACQTADLDPQILANTSTKWLARTSHYPDLQAMGRAMGLTSEQAKFLIHKLQPGKFALQLGEGDSRHPFLIQIPKTDVEALDQMNHGLDVDHLGPLDSLPVVPLRQRATQATPAGASIPASEPTDPTAKLFDSDAEVTVMKVIAEHPFIALRDLIRMAKMSSKTIAVHRKTLIDKGYIRERDIKKAGPGRSAIHLEALDAGRDAVAAHFGQGGAL